MSDTYKAVTPGSVNPTGQTFNTLLEKATGKGFDKITSSDIEKFGASNNYTRTAIKRMVRGFDKMRKDDTYRFNDDGTYSIKTQDGAREYSGRRKGNVKGFDVADVIGLGKDISTLAGALKDVKIDSPTQTTPSTGRGLRGIRTSNMGEKSEATTLNTDYGDMFRRVAGEYTPTTSRTGGSGTTAPRTNPTTRVAQPSQTQQSVQSEPRGTSIPEWNYSGLRESTRAMFSGEGLNIDRARNALRSQPEKPKFNEDWKLRSDQFKSSGEEKRSYGEIMRAGAKYVSTDNTGRSKYEIDGRLYMDSGPIANPNAPKSERPVLRLPEGQDGLKTTSYKVKNPNDIREGYINPEHIEMGAAIGVPALEYLTAGRSARRLERNIKPNLERPSLNVGAARAMRRPDLRLPFSEPVGPDAASEGYRRSFMDSRLKEFQNQADMQNEQSMIAQEQQIGERQNQATMARNQIANQEKMIGTDIDMRKLMRDWGRRDDALVGTVENTLSLLGQKSLQGDIRDNDLIRTLIGTGEPDKINEALNRLRNPNKRFLVKPRNRRRI